MDLIGQVVVAISVGRCQICVQKVDFSGSVKDRLAVRRLVMAMQRTQLNDEVWNCHHGRGDGGR